MKTVLDCHQCSRRLGKVKVEAGGKTVDWERPRQFVLQNGLLAYQHWPDVQIPVEALLDTGTDITVVKPEVIRRIERQIGKTLPVERRIEQGPKLEPAYDLMYVLPGGYQCWSRYGFIASTSVDFDIGDVWLGQDVFNKLVITFDGPNGTVTIVDPEGEE